MDPGNLSRVQLLEADSSHDFSAADQAVGKAIAFLYVLPGVEAAQTISIFQQAYTLAKLFHRP